MVKTYTIRDNDTIQGIAVKFFNDPTKWKDIVTFNNLDYPFITSDQNFVKETKASGIVRFYVKNTLLYDVVIPKNTIVAVNNTEKRYVTKRTVILTAGSFQIEVEAECEFFGYWGNVGQKFIDTIVSDIDENLLVTNDENFTNGSIINVKKTGETILVPITSESVSMINYDYDLLGILGKEDLLLVNRDIIEDKYGDIASVKGIGAILQRLKHRLETEKGDLPLHRDFGSNFFNLISRNEPFVEGLIKIEVEDCAMRDPAVEKIEITELKREDDVVNVIGYLKLTGQESEKFSLEIEA